MKTKAEKTIEEAISKPRETIIEPKLSSLVRDPTFSPREGTNPETVQAYRERTEAGGTFPPLVVWDSERGLVLLDGFHRAEAYKGAGKLENIEVELFQGTEDQARIFAAQANQSHGLPLTKFSKAQAVKMLCATSEGAKLSSRAAARLLGVSHTLVAQIRKKATNTTDEVAVNTLHPPEEGGTTGETVNTLHPGEPAPVDADPEPVAIQDTEPDQPGEDIPDFTSPMVEDPPEEVELPTQEEAGGESVALELCKEIAGTIRKRALKLKPNQRLALFIGLRDWIETEMETANYE